MNSCLNSTMQYNARISHLSHDDVDKVLILTTFPCLPRRAFSAPTN